MSALRTVLSALLIIVGGSLIALWAVSGVVVKAVEDGTAVQAIAARALDNDVIVDAVGDAIADGALDALADAGLDLSLLGLDDVVRDAIAGAARTRDFREAVLAQVDDAHGQLSAELTEEDRAPGPLVIDVDASAYVNGQIDRIPVVGERAPEVSLAPVPVEVMDADTFDDVRTGYRLMELAQRWALWAGLALIVLGLFVTHRLRWFMAKAGLAVGAIAGGLWLALRWWGVDGIAAVLPGGADGTAGSALVRIVSEDTVAMLEDRLSVIALIGFAVAAVFLVVALVTRPRVR
ncbi:hypothetical protein QQX09_02305 [Demequina sp. SYSU T00192]|uniref:Integral membrane protein n=1 Tax=Demequina litoralis TaxID=3051660 RepID=A0ABT8G6D1_9MICO|nr:hypothetical protein [Demequina sp. SYSU T00192]MDN4474681.1 hypothetical protein [Demequina sp. SYSU T00192]